MCRAFLQDKEARKVGAMAFRKMNRFCSLAERKEKRMDYLVRATAADDYIRAFAVVTKDMVEEARKAHNTSPVATAALGRLLTGAVMMGSMMKDEKDLLTIQVHGDGPLQGLIVTADSMGHAKGYAGNPQVLIHANEKGKLDVGGAVGKGMLQVIRDLGLKEPYVGTCDLVTGEIGDDLTAYFASSEQVPSSVGLGVLMDRGNTVRTAGGFIIQLMPFTPDEVIDRLEQKLSTVTSVTAMLDQGMTPEQLLEELLGEFGLKITDTMPVSWQCDCSVKRISRALISVGKKELKSMIQDGQPIEVCCHFCGKKYQFSLDELRLLLAKAQ